MKLASLWAALSANMFALGWAFAWSADAVANCLIVSISALGISLAFHYFYK